MNSTLLSWKNYLIALFTLAMSAVFTNNYNDDPVLIDYNFQDAANVPAELEFNGSLQPNKAADGVCTRGMVQINKGDTFVITVPAISYLQLNMKSTSASGNRVVKVYVKGESDADYRLLSPDLNVLEAKEFMLHETLPGVISTQPLKVKLIPDNGNIQIHDILVKGSASASSEALIYSFRLPQQISAAIDSDDGTIFVKLPQGIDLTSLVPESVSLSGGAQMIPSATEAQDFSQPVIYKVIAADGVTERDYTVTVETVASALKEITGFKLLPTQIGSALINEDEGTVSVTVPEGTVLTNIVPLEIHISPFAFISPAIETARDFSAPVTYTVTAQDLTTKTWTVSVNTVSNSGFFTDYEAEDAEFTGKVDNQHTGYSGTGFVDFLAGGENSILFTVCQQQAGSYSAKFVYALGKDEDRKGRLVVNDYYITTLQFNPTSGFTDWQEESVVISLNAGVNNIAIYWDETDGPNLDKMTLQGLPCETFTLNVTNSHDGVVELSPQRKNNQYYKDEVVTLLAQERPDLKFENWSGDIIGTDNPATITISADRSVQANYKVINTYTLNVQTEGIGAVELSPAGGVYSEGTTVTLTPVPVLDAQFIRWSGAVTGTAQPATIVMDGNKNVTAHFSNDLNINFDTPVGFAGVVTNEYANFQGPTTGGQGAADTLWIDGPADFDKLATSLYHRNRAYKNNRIENDMKNAPLVIVLKEGVYPEGSSSSSAWGNSMMTIQEQGDLTIIGQGNVILKWGFNIKRSWNILIRNITFMDYYDDGINIGEPETHHIWIDHCTVGNPAGRPANTEHPDGGIDVKGGASYVTISWTKYQNSWKTGLVGHSDGNASQDLGKLKVTYFANHFYNTNSRNPRVRFGEVHVLNNLKEQVTLYGIAASNQSQVYAEGNFYLNSRWPMYADRTTADFKDVYGNNSDNGFTSKTGNRPAKGLKAVNNDYDDSGLPVITSQINPAMLNPGGRSVKFDEYHPEEVFDPSSYYSYTAYPANVVRSLIPLFAGAEKVDFFREQSEEENEEPETPQQLAFPGAEGYGKYATGGRGGKVVTVTNLNDAGEGSFRYALEQYPNEPLTVVFNVGGVIHLESEIRVKRSNLTIAGETAPGDGICLTGASFIINGARALSQGGNHGNIIIRYIRSRPAANDPNGVYGIGLENVHNVIIDHCSFSWANEENAALYDTKNTTVQWSVISEGLWSAGHAKGNRSYGGVWGGQYASYHHNLIAHNNGRTVRFNGARAHDTMAVVDYRNNVIYNWGTERHATGGEIEIPGGVSQVNMVNNYYKPGPATPSGRNFIAPNTGSDVTPGQWYLSGNIMNGVADMTADNKLGVRFDAGYEGLSNTHVMDQPFEITVPLPVKSAQDAYTDVLAGAGAILPRRDAVDARIVQETSSGTATGTGSRNRLGIIDDPAVVGGLPEYEAGTPKADTDGDGIPDEYELANGLNPNNPADGSAIAANGYSNLENYFHSIVPSENEEEPEVPGQPSKEVSATWSLLSGPEPTQVAPEIEAQPQELSSLMAGVSYATSYSGTERIWQRSATNGLGLFNENSFVEYIIKAKDDQPLTVDSFSVAIVGGGSGNVRASVLYSKDNGVTYQPLATEANKAWYNGAETLAYSEEGGDTGDPVVLMNSGSVGAAAEGNEFLIFKDLNISVPAGNDFRVKIITYLRAEGGVRHLGQHSAHIAAKVGSGAEEPLEDGLFINGELKNFIQVLPNSSAIQTYDLIANGIQQPVTLNADVPYEISIDQGATWHQQVQYTPADSETDTVKVSVRLNGAATGSYNANITHETQGFDPVTIALTGNVMTPGSVIPDVIVAADGSGDYTSIQAAIDAAPANRTTPYVIFIKNGTYYEKVSVPQNKTFIHLVGESVANTILTYDDYAAKPLPGGGTVGTSNSYTLHVRGNDFMAMNLTVVNSYGDGSQAVAVHVQADRVVFKNCRMLGNQDTLLVNGNGYRQYYVNCYIDGNVDYIFGSAIAVFESCVIYSKTRTVNGNSYITAANTPAEQEYGLVFRNCELPSNRGNTLYVYGRPWQNSGNDANRAHNKTVFINTTIGKHAIHPRGWSTWDAGTDTDIILYAEYNTRYYDGTLVDVSQRESWSKQLTQTEADAYTNENIFGDWDPCAVVSDVCAPFSPSIAVSNFKVDKVNDKAAVTWNISWPMTGVKYELYKQINDGSWSLVNTVISENDTAVNFGYEDALPAPGVSYNYYLSASLSGMDTHITDTVTVSSVPTITVEGTLSEFKQGIGLPSVAQVYTVNAVNLLEPLTIQVPASFEVSVDEGATWHTGSTASVQPVDGVVQQVVQVRLNGNSAGSFSGEIEHSSGNAEKVSIAVTGTIQTEPLPVSDMLALYPLSANNSDDASVRSASVTVSDIRLNTFTLSDGTTVASVQPYSEALGMAFAATADGMWTTASGGPGGNLNKNIYVEFQITANENNRVRIDTLAVNASYYNTSSNTRFAVEYSLDGFAGDIRTVTGGMGNGLSLPSGANGAYTTPILLPNESSSNNSNYQLALNNADGVWLEPGQTITFRMYFSCGSTSPGRYAKIKNLLVKGDVASTIMPALTADVTTISLNQTLGAPSGIQSYTLKGAYLEGPVTVALSAPFAVSKDGTNYVQSLEIAPEEFGEDEEVVLSVRLNADAIGSYNTELVHTVEGLEPVTILLTGNTVAAPAVPTVSITGNLAEFEQTVGTAGTVQSFRVKAENITQQLSVIIPPGYELSLNNAVWLSSAQVMTIAPVNGKVDTAIYIRLNAPAVGEYRGNIMTAANNIIQTLDVIGQAVQPMTIHPNPVVSNLIISHPKLYTIATINIYTMSGVKVGSYKTTSNTNQTSIFVGHLKSGLYYVEYLRMNERKIFNFIKQ